MKFLFYLCSVNKIKKIMVRYCAIIFGCLMLGEIVVFLTKTHFPSSIIGMLCLTFFLKRGWLKLHWVKGISDLLIANLGLFFVPPCIKIILYYDVIVANFWAIILSMLISTVIVIYITGITYQFIRKQTKNDRIS